VVVGKAVRRAGKTGPARQKPSGVRDRRLARALPGSPEAGRCAALVFPDDVSPSAGEADFVRAAVPGVPDRAGGTLS